ncbi:hypothetical protein [Pseudomonas viridiflava]|uniref:hypothetical protein n=1 Tax=Pseudomonas viridiflava TaxID=33069 RepID=UPI000C06ABC8|nr:hypothetical protein [Pseudomonas viridiflava]MEE4675375.1 hypothetical protein [Pseudomonas alliivorans]MEE4694811.1 hypothetical protein [Pseudomonas alliivorans]MEE4701373.1 hypothetical protein [Pseudomonas alliivorans]MEE4737093.1 hypothetical protein [Pseudomonas alliivorans]MEE4752806.1 hypothetical protein [Pseudomonas alliivorans]
MTGITIKAADGRVLVDMTMKLSQTMGSVDTNSVNGAVTIPSPPAGKAAYFIIVPLVDLQREKGKKPGVTLSGTSLSWAYSYNTNGWGYFSANCRIYYGYY